MEGSLGDLYLKILREKSSIKCPSSLAQLPVTIWTRKNVPDDVVSDVSSIESSRESEISHSDDSVSSMSSSDTCDSIKSLQDLSNESVRHIPYGSEQLFETHPTLLNGGILDAEEQFKIVYSSLESLDSLSGLIMLQSNYDLNSTLRSAFQTITKLHKSVCIFLSIDCVIRNSQYNEERLVTDIKEMFKKVYSSIVTFQTLACKSASSENVPQIVNVFLQIIPYAIDILYSSLLNLLYHINEKRINMELIFIFEKMLQTSLLISCGYSDNSNTFTRIRAIETIYYLFIAILPLDLVNYIKNDVFETVDESLESNFRGKLIEKIWNEYSTGSFIPSGIILFKLIQNFDRGSKMRETSDVEATLRNSSITILGSCIRSGITKRQYPTNFISHSDYANSLLGKNSRKIHDVNNLNTWNKISFWLLMRLEDVNSIVRNYVLRIIRHIMSTIYLIEKDRQHILSYVFNCLSSDEVLEESLNILIYVSQLYPMKDGAVKRIATLTLKGSRKVNRLRTIIALGKCRFTPKGLSLLMSLFQILCTMSNDTSNTTEVPVQIYANSYISDQDSEVTFIQQELPAIIDALKSLVKSHNNIKLAQKIIDPPTGYVGKLPFTLPPGLWIWSLWKYMSNDMDECWRFCIYLLFIEAKMRFPQLVDKFDKSDLTFIADYLHLSERFIGLKIGDMDKLYITDEFVKDTKKWKMLHQLHIPLTREYLQRVKPILNNYCISEEVNVKNNKMCDCFDCKMDQMIVTHENKFDYLSSKLNNFIKCTRDENMKVESKIGERDLFFIGSHGLWNKNVYQKSLFIMTNHYNILPNLNIIPSINKFDDVRIDDIKCFPFPSVLGLHISIKIRCVTCGIKPPELSILLKIPIIKNVEDNCNVIMHVLWKRSQIKGPLEIFDGTVSHNLHYPYNMILPIRIRVLYMLQNENPKVCFFMLINHT